MTASPPIAAKGQLPSIVRHVARGDIVNLSSIAEMPAEAGADKQALSELGIQSLLMVPVKVDAVIVGAVSLASLGAARVWPEALVPRVRLIGEAFASLLARRQAAEQVGEARVETGQYRERLAHLVRVQTAGEMSAAIAHEINQPLVAIKNYALAARRRLAAGGAAEAARAEGLIDKIGAQASRAGDILQSLRAMVKKHQFEMAKVDMGRLVTDGLKLAELESNLANIRVEIAVASDLPMVLADEVQIQQVVLNLARNAIEAMAGVGISNSVVSVGVVGTAESEVMVSVSDCGPGIAPNEREHIFEPFFSTKELGLGIGLSVSRAIVEAHGGHLTVVPSVGGGSVFRFTLPAANDEE
jgi:signal transduction histidine kinase